MEPDLYRATVRVISEVGWDALTLDRVAEHAGRSRVTLWRNGITREALLDGLLTRLASDYRDAMVPVRDADLPPYARFERTLHALCDIVDLHAELLSISDDMFHRAYAAGSVPLGFLEPFHEAIRAARAAGILRSRLRDADLADVLFNATAWPYLHFRLRHRWPTARARRALIPTLLDGALEGAA